MFSIPFSDIKIRFGRLGVGINPLKDGAELDEFIETVKEGLELSPKRKPPKMLDDVNED